MFREQAPHRGSILCVEDSDEELVVGITLLATNQMAVEEEEESYGNQCNHSDEATVAHDRSDDDSDDEGGTSGDEPPPDDGHHPCQTPYGTLTTPRAVSQRRTHTDHEGDVSRGERKLEGSP